MKLKMKTIPLTQNKVALVDDVDFGRVSDLAWHACRRGKRVYAAHRSGWKGPIIYLHRLITGAPESQDVEHEDGNGLNNQRYNLLVCSRSRNLLGFQRLRENKTSRYRGVCWATSAGKWKAQINDCKNKTRHLGYFSSQRAAHIEYQKALRLARRVTA